MVVLAVLVASYALAVPFLQDDLTRRSQRTQQQQGNNGLTPQANHPNRQDDKQKNAGQQDNKPKKPAMEVKAQAVSADEEEIPDSLLHPRWQIQRTTPVTYDDLDQNPADLKRPDNLKQDVV